MSSKILIIDDNDQDIKIMRRFLIKAGFTDIHTAQTGKEGVENLKLLRPDLVILDTILPDIIGFEVCAKLREVEDMPDLKIIMMTGAIDAVDAVKARRSGADDYCVKTPNCGAMLEVVKKYKA